SRCSRTSRRSTTRFPSSWSPPTSRSSSPPTRSRRAPSATSPSRSTSATWITWSPPSSIGRAPDADRGRPHRWTASKRVALARRPDDPQARETLARLLRRQRRPAEAVATLREAPASGRTALALGGALLDDGRLDDAAAAFREAIDAAPADARAYVGLAAALERAGRLTDAAAAY